MSNAELLWLPSDQALRFLPEGPYPFGDGRFSWVAIQHGAGASFGSVNLFDWSSRTNTSYPLPGRPGFAFGTNRGNFVVGCERSVLLFSPEKGVLKTLIDGVDAHTHNTIINDGVTWDGNLIFGTKDLEFKTKKAGLYFWRARDQKLFALRNDQICSNGKCIVGANGNIVKLLDIDSPTKCVVEYEIDTEKGSIVSERILADLRSDEAVPDGMTLALDGKSIWISLYNPNAAPFGRTIQVDCESGKVLSEIRSANSPQATCPQWFVHDGELWMVITTAIEHMPADRQSQSTNAGALFAISHGAVSDLASYRNTTQPFIEP